MRLAYPAALVTAGALSGCAPSTPPAEERVQRDARAKTTAVPSFRQARASAEAVTDDTDLKVADVNTRLDMARAQAQADDDACGEAIFEVPEETSGLASCFTGIT